MPNPEINSSSPVTILENTPTPKWQQSLFENDEMDIHVCDPIRKSKHKISEQKKLLKEIPISNANTNQWGAHNVKQNCSWIVNGQLGHGKKDGKTLKIGKWNDYNDGHDG